METVGTDGISGTSERQLQAWPTYISYLLMYTISEVAFFSHSLTFLLLSGKNVGFFPYKNVGKKAQRHFVGSFPYILSECPAGRN